MGVITIATQNTAIDCILHICEFIFDGKRFIKWDVHKSEFLYVIDSALCLIYDVSVSFTAAG